MIQLDIEKLPDEYFQAESITVFTTESPSSCTSPLITAIS